MDVEQFIQQQVNPHRGGYPPHEVAQLIRLAWQHAKVEMGEDVGKQLRNVSDSFRAAIRDY